MIFNPTPGTYQCICDMCGKMSGIHPTMTALLAELNLGLSLWQEKPSWSIGHRYENLTADESTLMGYEYRSSVNDDTKHLCPSCRGIANHYRE